MRVLSLYSGIGGLDLAAESAGFEVAAFCECEPFCRRVLAHHWPHVPIYERDEDVTAERLRRDGILGPVADSTGRGHAVESQVAGREPAVVGTVAGSGGGVSERGTTPRVSQHGRTDAAGTPHLRETDDLIIIGGPPCQPSSAAGKRLGTADSRWRWPEAIRIVREIKPRWVCFENPVGIRTVESGRAFGAILGELAALGYRVGYDQWAAADVGAPHRRERVFIVGRRMADASDMFSDGGDGYGRVGMGTEPLPESGDDSWARHVAPTAYDGRQQRRPEPAGQQGRCDAAERGAGVADTIGQRRGGLTVITAGNDANGDNAGWQEEDGGSEQRGQSGDGQAVPHGARPQERSGRDSAARGALTAASSRGGRATQPCVGESTSRLPRWLAERWPARPGEQQAEWEAPRLARGVPERVAKLRALGNAVVPAQAAPIFAAIAEIEGAV